MSDVSVASSAPPPDASLALLARGQPPANTSKEFEKCLFLGKGQSQGGESVGTHDATGETGGEAEAPSTVEDTPVVANSQDTSAEAPVDTGTESNSNKTLLGVLNSLVGVLTQLVAMLAEQGNSSAEPPAGDPSGCPGDIPSTNPPQPPSGAEASNDPEGAVGSGTAGNGGIQDQLASLPPLLDELKDQLTGGESSTVDQPSTGAGCGASEPPASAPNGCSAGGDSSLAGLLQALQASLQSILDAIGSDKTESAEAGESQAAAESSQAESARQQLLQIISQLIEVLSALIKAMSGEGDSTGSTGGGTSPGDGTPPPGPGDSTTPPGDTTPPDSGTPPTGKRTAMDIAIAHSEAMSVSMRDIPQVESYFIGK